MSLDEAVDYALQDANTNSGAASITPSPPGLPTEERR